jgi:hypothetical protein
MNQQLDTAHDVDENGNPHGGHAKGVGIDINWQRGPLGRDGDRAAPNGAFVEGVIAAAIDRIEFYQDSRFHSVENAVALGHLRAALEVLTERTRAREDRKVEGTHAV